MDYQEFEQTGYGNKFTYSFTAKYEQNIVPVWPRIEWVKNNSSGSRTFYGWDKPGTDSVQVTNMYTMEGDLFGKESGLSIAEGKLVGSGNLPAVASNVFTQWVIYARTTLPNEKADFDYATRKYTIYSEACQSIKTTRNLGYKSLMGCKPVPGEPNFEANYGNLSGNTMGNRYNKVTVVSANSMQKIFDLVFPNKIYHGSWYDSGDSCEILLYDRNTITLSLHVNDDVYGTKVQQCDYLYGDWIYDNDQSDLLKRVDATKSKNGYVFAGWYTDPNFTDGTQYIPDENSRINASMNLYAKWEPNQFKAKFYLYMDDLNPYREQGFAEGQKLTDWLVPVAVQGSFLGWYWYQNGVLQPFDFTSAVGANHVDDQGIVKLYAHWVGENGRVSYLPGKGGDNSTQEVLDSKEYAINEASVYLETPGNVWNGEVPSDSGLTFVGWKAPNGAIYQPGRYVPVTRILMQFEAQWSTDAVSLIYDANGGDGDNVRETWARNSEVDIWDNMDLNTPHFSRTGYELIGWGTKSSATTPTYKLGEGTIVLSEDTTTLYAIWKKTTVDVEITKIVDGSFGDRSKSFSFTVTSTDTLEASDDSSYELIENKKIATFELKHNETVTLKGVQVGSTLTIAETNAKGYTMTIKVGDTSLEGAEYRIPTEVSKSVISIVVQNFKDGNPDTGILLDSMPYVVILGIAIFGIAVFVVRKRKKDDSDLD